MILCPKCNKEMVEGITTFMGATGLTPMICNFCSNAEKEKSMFARNEITKTMLQGLEVEAYCCEDCKIVMPIIE